MITAYFKIAYRNLWRHKVLSVINILGLCAGIAASFLIYLYIHFEMTYDRFHRKADRIYRLVPDAHTSSGTNDTYFTAAPMAVSLRVEFPEVESAVRMQPNSILITRGDVKFQEENTIFADSSLFSVFDFHLTSGDPRTALSEPFSIVLSESAAKKYFGKSEPVGQMVTMTGRKMPAKVTGIMKDIPENSQIKADMFVSLTTITQKWDTAADNQWTNLNYITYLLMQPSTDITHFQAKLPGFLTRHLGKGIKAHQITYVLHTEPLIDVYLHSTYGGMIANGNIRNVYIFSIIAAFVLLIACINFINLSTARAMERAKEVGIRKVVGAIRFQLIKQFIAESVLTCLFAFLMAMILSSSFIPLFNRLAGQQVSEGILSNIDPLIAFSFLSITLGILAGIYPAFVLSAYKPVLVLKGRFASGIKGIVLRKILVTTQFSISILMIIATIVIYRQLQFMRSQDPGFNKDQTVVIETNGDPAAPTVKQEISGLPGVVSTAFSNNIPGSGNTVGNNVAPAQIENKSGQLQPLIFDFYLVDFDYLQQFQMTLVAGRPFSRDYASDSTAAMIINETAVRKLGYSSPPQVIGKQFEQFGGKGNIVGVVKDFHTSSLQNEIKPVCLRVTNQYQYFLTAKVETRDLPKTISAMEKIWEKTIPVRPFNYFFLDEYFDRQYRAEVRAGNLFLDFAILTILISCLGLLGLASYSTLQRSKEIALRKVLGASVPGIVNLLSKDFLILVFLAFIISTPIAWFAMGKWLQGFAYRVNISWWIFLISGLSAVLIAQLTVSFQAIKAAHANPVDRLRNE